MNRKSQPEEALGEMSTTNSGQRGRRRAVVVCPGRGTYNKAELGYLKRLHSSSSLVSRIDACLAKRGEPTLSSLDAAERFSLAIHTPGERASTLIYACSAADFDAIDRERFDVVAVTGNSMGWYTSLAIAGALRDGADFELIHTMGSMMAGGIIGGQLIYPLVDKEWRRDPIRQERVDAAVAEVQSAGLSIFTSIEFGGYRIFGGEPEALARLKSSLPVIEDRYPFLLVNHAAFHTPMMGDVSRRALTALPATLFQKPSLPLIDGRGKIWQPWDTCPDALREYTLTHQVTETYDFSAAISVALKEYAPAAVIVLGPGSTMGGAIAQAIISLGWHGLRSKSEFTSRQQQNPYILAMGRADQRAVIVA